MGDSFMSVHLFEEESSGHLWEAGKTYSIDLAETQYDELWLEATLKGIDQGVATDLLEEAGGRSHRDSAARGIQAGIGNPAHEPGGVCPGGAGI